ncbi:MAG: hypothetical protein HQ503_03410 [Rhodospirillales bacterium]|nr:hypothetical protein [Rhodospirillales bacterium]
MEQPVQFQRSVPTGRGISTTIQFLSLYLLVLAFFILLVTISTFENVKSKAVMDSLNSTFAPVRRPSTELTVFTSNSGRFIGAQEFQDVLNGLFTTALGVEKIEIVQPGSIMRVILDADSLFHRGTVKIREGQIPLVDRIIASLSSRPPGLHYDIEFIVGSEPNGTELLPTGQSLQMARAGSFVREMLSRGTPPDTISIGMRSDEPDKIEMWFYVRPSSEVGAVYRALAATFGESKLNRSNGGAPNPNIGIDQNDR